MNDNSVQAKKMWNEEKLQTLIVTIRPYFQCLWQLRKRIIAINVVVILLSLVYLIFFMTPNYVSTVSLLPEYGGKSSMAGLGGLADIAAIAGLDVAGGSPMEIYKNLITSESVLEPVIMSKYRTEEYPDSVNLIQYFNIKPGTSDKSIDLERAKFLKMYKMLVKSSISVDLDLMSKILTLDVNMPERMLSADVVNRIVLSLDNYIRTKKKSYASEQRFYLEKRITQVQDTLSFYEEALERFRENNKVITQSPELLMEEARLMRDQQISESVFTTLENQLELVKLDEIRDAPVLNVREFARDPVVKSGQSRKLYFITMLFFANLCIVGYYWLKMNKSLIATNVKYYWNQLAKD